MKERRKETPTGRRKLEQDAKQKAEAVMMNQDGVKKEEEGKKRRRTWGCEVVYKQTMARQLPLNKRVNCKQLAKEGASELKTTSEGRCAWECRRHQ